MNEEKPWEGLGISEDRFYTADALEYWKERSVKQLWDEIINVGGSYLSLIRACAHLLDLRISDSTPLEEIRAKNLSTLAKIVDRTQRIEEMLILMNERLQFEVKHSDESPNISE